MAVAVGAMCEPEGREEGAPCMRFFRQFTQFHRVIWVRRLCTWLPFGVTAVFTNTTSSETRGFQKMDFSGFQTVRCHCCTACSQVTLHGRGESGSSVDFYKPVLDEKGSPRRLAVKRMPWDVINKKLGRVREVSYILHG